MSHDTLTTLAARMRWARLHRNLTQEELAKKAGTSQSQVYKIEQGRVKRPRNIGEIARALDVSPAWLQFGEAKIDRLSTEALQMAVEWQALPAEAQGAVIAMIRAMKPEGR